MSDEASATTSGRPNPFDQVSDSVFRYVVHCLYRDVLSPDVTDPEEARLIIDAGIAAVASMIAANADEANVAVRVVTADANASACIGYANRLAAASEFVAAGRCRAQANHFHRTTNAARALLLRVQAARRKREAIADARNTDAWHEHCVAGLMVAADRGAPKPGPVAGPGPEMPAPPTPSATEPEPLPPRGEDDKFARYDVAEQYAAIHPRRAAEIRVHGGVPGTATWGSPDPATVEALLASTSPLVLQADQEFAHTLGS